MTTAVKVAAGIGALAATAAIGIGATAAVSNPPSAAAVSTFPPAPQNLRAYEVGPTYAKVSFGPSIVGPFTHDVPAPNGRSMVVRWGGATDALYPLGITYDFYKNNKLVWSNRAQTYANVGFTLKVRSFSVCAVPHSQSGFGPKRCTTFTGQ